MKYTVCFMATGGITLEADDMDDAIRQAQDLDVELLCEILAENGISITEAFEEGL